MDHAVLNRFNLPSKGRESFIRARPDWLVNRVELFERYCLPSVRSQDSRHFGWLIYFDPESPDWLRDRINGWSADGTFAPLFCQEVSRAELRHDIEEHVGRTDEVADHDEPG